MTHPGHQLAGAGPGRGCQVVAGVAQVVEVQATAVHAGGGHGGGPDAVEVPTPEVATLGGDEDQSVLSPPGETVAVITEVTEDGCREGDCAHTGASLGALEEHLAARSARRSAGS
ncbi:MAG: hypothetical protein M3P83_08695 [Actinomycetota bacterium]|nr:hypothetical protein [Actinomycetota bacterium]